MKNLMIIFFTLAVSGCGFSPSKPTDQEIASADYGAYPHNYKDIIKNYMEKKGLYEFETVKYRFENPPKKFHTTGKKLFSTKFNYSVSKVYIEAKFIYKSNVSEQEFSYNIKNGRVKECVDVTQLKLSIEEVINKKNSKTPWRC
jgi:hypothetical protein